MPLGERMTPFAAACWHLERAGQPMHAGALYLLDGGVGFDETIAEVEARLVALPRWRARALPVPLDLGHPTWEPAHGFDVRDHVIRHLLREPQDDAQLERLVSRLFAHPLDRQRPLWELHHVDGYHGDRTALLLKVHHCLLGGVHGSDLERVLFEVTPTRKGAPPAAAEPGGGTAAAAAASAGTAAPYAPASARLWAVARDIARSGVAWLGAVAADPAAVVANVGAIAGAGRDLLAMHLAPAAETPLRGHVSTLRRIAWTVLPLADVKATRSRLGGTTADVVLAAISAALRRWLEGRGFAPDRLELRALCPTGVRGEHEQRLDIVVAPLPVGIHDPLERHRQVRAERERALRTGASERTARALGLMAQVPAPLQRPLGWLEAQSVPVDTVCTSVPASPVALYLRSRRVEAIVPLVPLAQGVGLAFGVVAYADELSLGVTFDPALIRDGEHFPELVRAAIDELAALAGVERPPRRDPVRPERQRRSPSGSPRVA